MKLINLLRQMQTLMAAIVKQEGVCSTAEKSSTLFFCAVETVSTQPPPAQ